MRTLYNICLITTVLTVNTATLAYTVPKTVYCDSSTGRYILNNGDTSSQYCTIHATMNLNKFSGCCMWHGGVAKNDGQTVHCNDGTDSEICALQIPHDNAVIY